MSTQLPAAPHPAFRACLSPSCPGGSWTCSSSAPVALTCCVSRASRARPFIGTFGRASPALSPLSSHLLLFLSPSRTVYIQCFSGALLPSGRRAACSLMLYRNCKCSPLAPCTWPRAQSCLGSLPRPHPTLLCPGLSGCEGGRPPAPPSQSPSSLLTIPSVVSSRSSCMYGTCCLWGKTYSIGFLRFCKQVCAPARAQSVPGSSSRRVVLPLLDRVAEASWVDPATGCPGSTLEFPFPASPPAPKPQHSLPTQLGMPLHSRRCSEGQ